MHLVKRELFYWLAVIVLSGLLCFWYVNNSINQVVKEHQSQTQPGGLYGN